MDWVGAGLGTEDKVHICCLCTWHPTSPLLGCELSHFRAPLHSGSWPTSPPEIRTLLFLEKACVFSWAWILIYHSLSLFTISFLYSTIHHLLLKFFSLRERRQTHKAWDWLPFPGIELRFDFLFLQRAIFGSSPSPWFLEILGDRNHPMQFTVKSARMNSIAPL